MLTKACAYTTLLSLRKKKVPHSVTEGERCAVELLLSSGKGGLLRRWEALTLWQVSPQGVQYFTSSTELYPKFSLWTDFQNMKSLFLDDAVLLMDIWEENAFLKVGTNNSRSPALKMFCPESISKVNILKTSQLKTL